MEFPTWSNLADDVYCIQADLNKFNSGGNLTWLDSDYSCFQVGNTTNGTGNGTSGWIYTWTDNTYYSSGATVNATLTSTYLTLYEDYEIEWELEDINGTVVDDGNFTWTAYYTQSMENLTWSSLADDYYCLYADLSYDDNGTLMWLDYDYSCFQVGNTTNGSGGSGEIMSVYGIMGHHMFGTSNSNGLPISVRATSLVSTTNYSIHWEFSSNGTAIDSGYSNWTATTSWHNANTSGVFSNIPLGNYTVIASLHYAGSSAAIDSTTYNFSIVSNATGSFSYAYLNPSIAEPSDEIKLWSAVYGLLHSSSYSFEWTITNTTLNGTIDFSPAYNAGWGTMTSIGNLSAGIYCLNADLYNGSVLLDSISGGCTIVRYSTGNIYTGLNSTTTFPLGVTPSVTVYSNQLTVNDTYQFQIELLQGATVVDTKSFNWTANTWGHIENVAWYNLSVGSYTLITELLVFDGTTWVVLDSETYYFNVTFASTGDMYVGTSVNGTTMQAYVNSYNLNLNYNYTLSWMLIQSSTNSTYDYGSFPWTAYNTSSTEYFSWNNLSSDTYCLDAYLYDSTGAMRDGGSSCRYISNGSNGTGNTTSPWVWISTYDYAGVYHGDITSYDLVLDETYSMSYELLLIDSANNTTIIDNGTYNWYAYYGTSYENNNWTALAEGSYCINAELFHASSFLDSHEACFTVTSGNGTGGGESYEELNVWMTTTYLPWGDDVSVNLDSTNLVVGTNYTLLYALYTSTGVGVDSYYWNWYAYYNTSNESVSWANLAIGNYCLNATLKGVDSNGTMTTLDEEQQCFEIYMPVYNEWINILTPGSTYDEDISQHLNYASSDIVVINITAYDLDPTQIYNLTFDICKADSEDNCPTFATGDSVMAITPTNNIFQIVNGSQNWNQNIVTFSEGCYVISSYLFNGSGTTAVAMDLGLTFSVGRHTVCEDYDGDGVNNTNDAFPGSSSEWGDADGDGVGDNADQCDNSTAGESVDSTGCPEAPADTDGDGISDTSDLCPDTPAGTVVDSTGCPEVDDPTNGTGDNNTGDNNTDDPTGDDNNTGSGDDPTGDDNNTGSGDDPTEDDDPPASDSGGLLPGFTSVIAALSLLGAAFLSRRRLET